MTLIEGVWFTQAGTEDRGVGGATRPQSDRSAR